jgi:hypothetical protein
MGQNDDWFCQVTEFFAAFSEKLTQQPFLQIEDIKGTFRQIAVTHFLELFRITAQHTAYGKLGGAALVPN